MEGELEEVDPNIARFQFRNNRANAQDLDSLVAVGRMKGMSNPEGWARHVLTARKTKAAKKAARYG